MTKIQYLTALGFITILTGCSTVVEKPNVRFSVKDYETKQPIEGAKLYVMDNKESKLIAVSDANGLLQVKGENKTVFHGYPFPIPTPGGTFFKNYELAHPGYGNYVFHCIYPRLVEQTTCGIRAFAKIGQVKKELYLEQGGHYSGDIIVAK